MEKENYQTVTSEWVESHGYKETCEMIESNRLREQEGMTAYRENMIILYYKSLCKPLKLPVEGLDEANGIGYLDLDTRLFNVLLRSGCVSIGDIMKKVCSNTLKDVRNLGVTSQNSLLTKLNERGFLPDYQPKQKATQNRAVNNNANGIFLSIVASRLMKENISGTAKERLLEIIEETLKNYNVVIKEK